MRTTLRIGAASFVATAGENGVTPGMVYLAIISGKIAAAGIEVTPDQAAMLAGEIERAAWAATKAREQADRQAVADLRQSEAQHAKQQRDRDVASALDAWFPGVKA